MKHSYILVKEIDLSHSEVTYIGFDGTNPTNSFSVFWKSLQNARVVPNPVSVYSPDGQSKVQNLPDEIKDKVYSTVKTRCFSKSNMRGRVLFNLFTAREMWKKQIGLITLLAVIVDIFIG